MPTIDEIIKGANDYAKNKNQILRQTNVVKPNPVPKGNKGVTANPRLKYLNNHNSMAATKTIKQDKPKIKAINYDLMKNAQPYIKEPWEKVVFERKAQNQFYQPDPGLYKQFSPELKQVWDNGHVAQLSQMASKSPAMARQVSFVDSMANGMFLGLPDVTDKTTYGKQMTEQVKANHPVASFAGSAAGYAATGMGVDKVAAKGFSKLGLKGGEKLLAKKTAELTAKDVFAKSAMLGTSNAALGAVEGVVRGDDWQTQAKNAGLNFLGGAILSGGIDGVGKGFNKTADKARLDNVLKRLNNDEPVQVGEIYGLSQLKKAREEGKSYTPTMSINTPERQMLRQKVGNDLNGLGSYTGVAKNGDGGYNGSIIQDKRVDVVIGPPAAGKSSVFVNPLSKRYSSRVIDSDMAKERLPEFDNGMGAGRVHEESSKIAQNLLAQAIAKGDNIVYPTVGGNIGKLKEVLDVFKRHGYTVNVHLNELSTNKATGRVIKRFLDEGRYVDPEIVLGVGNKPTENYKKLREMEGYLNGYSHFSNDVPFGEKPIQYETTETDLWDAQGLHRDGRINNDNRARGINRETSNSIAREENTTRQIAGDEPAISMSNGNIGIDYDIRNNEAKNAVPNGRVEQAQKNTPILGVENAGKLSTLKDFVVQVIENPTKTASYIISKVSDRATSDIRRLLNIDVKGYEHNITNRTIAHISKRHGKGGVADHSMQDINDITLIEEVLEKYDNVKIGEQDSLEYRNSNNTKAKTVVYDKAMPNGIHYVVEAVPDTRAKKMQIVSAYIDTSAQKKGNEHAPHVTKPWEDVQNGHTQLPFLDPNIPQNGNGVNSSILQSGRNIPSNSFEAKAASSLGLGIEYDKTLGEVLGSYDGKTIRINPAKANTPEAARYVLGHELAHDIQLRGKYADVETHIYGDLERQGITQDDINDIKAVIKAEYASLYPGEGLSDLAAKAEFEAKYLEQLFSDEITLKRLAKENPSFFTRLGEWLTDMIKKYRGTSQEKAILELRQKFVAAARSEQVGVMPNSRQYSFMGVNAKTANLEDLEVAKKMKASGVNDQEIWQSTGWYLGNDGKWRFETADNLAKLNLSGSGQYQGKLGNLLDHPSLFEAYPELRDLPTKMDIEPNVAPGSSYYERWPTGEEIYVKASPENAKQVLLHEAQHGIQTREGFSPGTSQEYWAHRHQESLAKQKQLQQEFNGFWDGSEVKDRAAQIHHRLSRGEISVQEVIANLKALAAREGKTNEFADLLVRLGKVNQEMKVYKGRSFYDLYYNNMGEIEARDTAARVDLSGKERREILPNWGNENTITLVEKKAVGKQQWLNPDFKADYDAWVNKYGRSGYMRLHIGSTSEALKSVGVKEQNVYWDTGKINKTLAKHKNLNDSILKQVPNILEHPIIIMQSKRVQSRITMFGEVYDKSGLPVLAVLELEPTNNQGLVLNEIKLASTYSKDSFDTATQEFINASRILYVDPNKKRTNTWLSSNRLQLPFGINKYGSIDRIAYNSPAVNNIIRKNGGNDTQKSFGSSFDELVQKANLSK